LCVGWQARDVRRSSGHLDACFVKAYPAETTEALLDDQVAAFTFFGGMPLSLLYSTASSDRHGPFRQITSALWSPLMTNLPPESGL
jgi:hypothetical protein